TPWSKCGSPSWRTRGATALNHDVPDPPARVSPARQLSSRTRSSCRNHVAETNRTATLAAIAAHFADRPSYSAPLCCKPRVRGGEDLVTFWPDWRTTNAQDEKGS